MQKNKCRQFSLSLIAIFCAAIFCYAQNSSLNESEKALFRGDAKRAEMFAAQWLKAHPTSAPARVMLARATMAQGNFQAAYAHLRYALANDPNNIDALYYLGIVAGALTQFEYQQLFTLAPNSERVHQLLAESFQAQAKPSEAEAEYQAALTINPKSIEVLIALGEMKRLQSQFIEAATYYTRVVEIAPDDYDGLYGLGACLAYLQNHAEAITCFRRALAVEPNAADAKFAVGNSLFQLRKFDEAESELKSALALEPNLRQAYFLLGQIHQRAGRTAEAQAAFAKFEQLAQSELNTSRGQATAPATPSTQPPRKPTPKKK